MNTFSSYYKKNHKTNSKNSSAYRTYFFFIYLGTILFFSAHSLLKKRHRRTLFIFVVNCGKNILEILLKFLIGFLVLVGIKEISYFYIQWELITYEIAAIAIVGLPVAHFDFSLRATSICFCFLSYTHTNTHSSRFTCTVSHQHLSSLFSLFIQYKRSSDFS